MQRIKAKKVEINTSPGYTEIPLTPFFPLTQGKKTLFNASLCKRNFLRSVAHHSKGHIAECLGFAYS